MFQFSAFAYYTMYLQYIRLPHSETRGSIRICRSPRLIAACRVLHRLREPRHPPCALSYFLPLYGPFATIWVLRRPIKDGCCCLLYALVFFQYVKELIWIILSPAKHRKPSNRGE